MLWCVKIESATAWHTVELLKEAQFCLCLCLCLCHEISGEAFMSAILALLHLNFGGSYPSSTGHQKIHFLNFFLSFSKEEFFNLTGHSSADVKSS